MVSESLTVIKDYLLSKLCYQLFITPIPFSLDKQYHDFAYRACEFVRTNRTEIIHCNEPRHYVIHRFASKNPQAKKVLITHGWMSRAAYMIRLIKRLRAEGYDIYALDFPAHGESKGFQLTWSESVNILQATLNRFGPFYAAIGHSFGGAMILHTLNLANQFPDSEIIMPERAVLIASPTSIRKPVSGLARRFNLSGRGLLRLRQTICDNSHKHLKYLNFRHLTKRGNTPILCVHGQEDLTILPQESIAFCRHYPHASLALLPGVDHIDVLIDPRVETAVSNFLGG